MLPIPLKPLTKLKSLTTNQKPLRSQKERRPQEKMQMPVTTLMVTSKQKFQNENMTKIIPMRMVHHENLHKHEPAKHESASTMNLPL